MSFTSLQHSNKKLVIDNIFFFCDVAVYSLAERMYKEGMGISATYVRRKGLRALLPDVKLPVLVKPRPSVKNTVEAKKRACSPSEETCSKKLRCSLETTPETDTLQKSVTSSPLSDTPCEKSSSTKRPCTEPDYAAKRFKQEDVCITFNSPFPHLSSLT